MPHGDGHRGKAGADARHLRPAPGDQSAIRETVEKFDAFTEDNNPHGGRDFGAFEHAGQRIFWKVDYYTSGRKRGSEDPADPNQTVRVLTIMLACEY
jgi:Protein of unknown function (DUF3768)